MTVPGRFAGNLTDAPARVLGLWSPGSTGLAFMADVGSAIPPGGAPDPNLIAKSTGATVATYCRST
jgi:hypothetical protein